MGTTCSGTANDILRCLAKTQIPVHIKTQRDGDLGYLRDHLLLLLRNDCWRM
jgi:hypothetical protein